MMIDHDNCLVKILQVTIWSSATNTVAIDIRDTETFDTRSSDSVI